MQVYFCSIRQLKFLAAGTFTKLSSRY